MKDFIGNAIGLALLVLVGWAALSVMDGLTHKPVVVAPAEKPAPPEPPEEIEAVTEKPASKEDIRERGQCGPNGCAPQRQQQYSGQKSQPQKRRWLFWRR